MISDTNTHFGSLLIRSLLDHYRCPDESLKYTLDDSLGRNAHRFTIGPSLRCYGRTANDARTIHLPFGDHSASEPIHGGAHPRVLPFDPDEVIDNLRLERYSGCGLNPLEKTLKRAYYSVRHLTSPFTRGYIQRLRAANWTARSFPQWPVDTTVDTLLEMLLLHLLQVNGCERLPFVWFWPDAAEGCVIITHDVEELAGRDFCSELMDLDDSFGFTSSFQIVPENRYPVPQEFLRSFRSRGFELCVQDLNHDGRLFDEFWEFRRRASLINLFARKNGAMGFRSAVLYRNPKWFEYLDFSYDMSMPNAAHLDPQRGGCCTVMPYFIGDILEIPLTTVQDYTLFHILKQQSLDLWKLQVEMILSKYGLVTFLVHPDYIIEPAFRSVYRSLLRMLKKLRSDRHLWFACPGEVAKWWRQRSQMKLVSENGSWKIIGEGAERARLAFARISDGRLVYDFTDEKQDKPLPGQARSPAVVEVCSE